jgi:Zn-dependent protease
MEEHIRLGQVAGVRVGANWSLTVVFGLVLGSLAAVELPHAAPGYPTVAYGLAAVAATVLFYQSLVAHELAHSVVARRAGMRVGGIVLCLLGGVSRLEGQPPGADVELRVAIAGPAASAAFGGGFLALAHAVDVGGGGALLTASLSWLGVINVLIAVFNLLPAYPLDGGHILRAVLWRWRADVNWATAAATLVARLLGGALAAAGVACLALGTGRGSGQTAVTGVSLLVTGSLLAWFRRTAAPCA